MWLAVLLFACTRSEPPPPEPDDAGLDGDEGTELEGGLFHKARLDREIAALEALGYVEGGELSTGRSGVVVHAPDTAPGRMLWSSGHAPEAYLMELDGTIRHTWRKTFDEAFPGAPPSDATGRSYWRRVVPLEDGGLLAVFEGQGLIRLDRESHLVWALAQPVHHAVQVLPDGKLLTLTRHAHLEKRVNPSKPILEDSVAIVSADGVLEREVSVLEALLATDLVRKWSPRKGSGDLFHTNAVLLLDGRWADRLPEWTAGRVLVSVRAWDALLVLDLDRKEVVWVGKGDWKAQHDPRVLDDTLLLFDNLGAGRTTSRVLELDPTTMQPVWTYSGDAQDPFFSRFCGAAARLGDGATLISDTWSGRAFEVDRAGRIRWEFFNPNRAGEQQELVAVIPEMIRLPPDWGDAWLAPVAPAP